MGYRTERGNASVFNSEDLIVLDCKKINKNRNSATTKRPADTKTRFNGSARPAPNHNPPHHPGSNWFHSDVCNRLSISSSHPHAGLQYLYGPAGRRADEGGGAHGGRGGEAALPLLLVDAVALGLGQLQEVLHGPQVDQQRLRRRLGVFLLTEDLRQ